MTIGFEVMVKIATRVGDAFLTTFFNCWVFKKGDDLKKRGKVKKESWIGFHVFLAVSVRYA